jgi:hypothetical protein
MVRTALAVVVIVFLGLPAAAHHNYRLNFDDSKEIVLEGIVSRISWGNPHITIYLDVMTEDDETISWEIPTAAPNVARQNGFTDAVLKAGEEIHIVGWPARDDSRQMRARMVRVSDGSEYLLHPTGDRRNRNRRTGDPPASSND